MSAGGGSPKPVLGSKPRRSGEATTAQGRKVAAKAVKFAVWGRRMQFDREALLDLGASRIAAWVGAGALVAMTAGAAALLPRGGEEAPTDTVTVSGPIFTPVPSAPAPPALPAAAPGSSRASDSFATPATDDGTLVRGIQQRLADARCYRGAVNGAWNAATRRGMAEFTQKANARLPVDRPAPVLLALLEQNEDLLCGAGCVGGGDQGCTPRETAPTPRAETAAVAPVPPSVPPPREPDAKPAALEPAVLPAREERPAPEAVAIEESDTEGVMPAPVPGVRKSTASEPRRASRRYKRKPSLARQVDKGFRQLQRTLNKLF